MKILSGYSWYIHLLLISESNVLTPFFSPSLRQGRKEGEVTVIQQDSSPSLRSREGVGG